MSFRNRAIFTTLPRTQRGMPLVLGGDPKEKNFLYTNGNSVIIRDINNPMLSDIYTEHSVPTTVAKYSPSGFYICSADQSGKIRIWDTTQKEHILKNEFQPFVGTIKDLAWSFDNYRICVVGEGRERFGHVFMSECGTSVGEISGHSNLINSCDFRPKRPFRIITGSEDNSVGIYEGPPFKFKTTLNDHTRFVQSVRFSPDGELFASGGFDGKMFLYIANDYSKVGEFGSPAHSGGIYGVSWSPDGTKMLSASGDKSCKLWDVATMSVITDFTFGSDVMDQQVSCLWQGQHLLSVSLSGFINYLDLNNPKQPLRVIKGHNKSITALAISQERNTIYSASHDGAVMSWDAVSGSHDRIQGKGHSNQVQDVVVSKEFIRTCSLDDTLKTVNTSDLQYRTEFVKLNSQPRGIASISNDTCKDLVLVAGINEISVIRDGKKVNELPVNFEPQCISILPISISQETDVAVGGGRDNNVHVFTLNGHNLNPRTTLEHRGAITDCSYSPNGKYLAACDSNRKVVVYDVPTYEPSHNQDWCFHTARVNCLAWSPNSLYLVSGSLDTNIIIWTIEQPTKHLIIRHAHSQSQITRVAWLDDKVLVSAGQDSNIKIWDIEN